MSGPFPDWASPGVGRIWCSANPDGAVSDQTDDVQAALDLAMPGQTVVLPPGNAIRCGAIKIPSGVNLESLGAKLVGATISFGPSISQAFNSVLRDVWFKQCKFLIEEVEEAGTLTSATSTTASDSSKNWAQDEWLNWVIKINSGTGAPQTKRILGNSAQQLQLSSAWATQPDATSVYSIFCNLSCIVFDHCTIDGTDYSTNSGSTSGDAVRIGQFGFDIKFVNGTQIYNYTGHGVNVIGNPDEVNGTGSAFLAAGVFVTMSDFKVFNCNGCAIRLFAAPQDGGSLHMSNVLLDHCGRALLVDNTVNGNPNVAPTLSGGWTVFGTGIRVELCGDYAGQSLESILIQDPLCSVDIYGLWYSSSKTTNFYKNIWHRSGVFNVNGGRITKGAAQAYGVYCDPGVTCGWDVREMGTEYNIGALKSTMVAEATSRAQISYLRFRLTKTAGGITAQRLTGNGFGFGAGGQAGDAWSTDVSGDMTNGGATQPVGQILDKLYYQLSAGGGQVRVQMAYRVITRVMFAQVADQNAGITNITPDCKLLNGQADFTIILKNASGTEINLNSALTVGQFIDVTVGVCAERAQ